MDGRSTSLRGKLASRCVLVEAPSGLILVDTALGLRDIAAPTTRLSPFFRRLMAPELREEVTAVRQIEALGFAARDVRHIVLTHLDFDHAGGLDDFPGARVHMLAAEREHALKRATWLDRQRYRPEQWSTRSSWQVHEAGSGDNWFGFEAVRDLDSMPAGVLMIPLIGHTWGHVGVAVQVGDRWLLQAGDAYFHHREMDVEKPWCTPGLRLYQTMLEKDRRARLRNQQRLRELKAARGGVVQIFSSHDPVEFERLSGRSARVPESAFTTRLEGGAPLAR